MKIKFRPETLQAEVSGWTDKLSAAQADLAALPGRREAAEAKRAEHVLDGRVNSDEGALAELEAARLELAAIHDEESELTLLVEQIQAKLTALEAQRQDAERQALTDQLVNEQEPQRYALMKEVEEKTAELGKLLSALDELGKSMEQTGDKIYGFDTNAEGFLWVGNILGNYLHGELGRWLPNHFNHFWGRGYENLAELDKERVEGFLKRALSRTTKGEKRW